jgi:hypothetical protein
MKKLIASALLIASTGILFAQGPTIVPPQTSKKVQVAILFDTSNSMDGLIDQAKSRIWKIINEVSALRCEGAAPTIEIAIYEYGNDGLSKNDNYIRLVLDLSTDLDEISKNLFALATNGGSEYCGAVIEQSIKELKWSDDPTDLKMIYIAGNEAFDQGPVNYEQVCKSAKSKNIYVNTIFCGDYHQGANLLWENGATCSGGDYFNIDSDKAIAHINTPYDEQIRMYNDSLNGTYYGYGSRGLEKKSMQISEDYNATSQATSVATDRAVAKSKSGVYMNSSWDLIDAAQGGKDINEMKEEELPEEFRGKTAEEKTALLEEKKLDRERYQVEIGKLAQERETFIEEKRKEQSEAGEEADDFGTNVNKSIVQKAKLNGFNKEAPGVE